MTYRSTKGASNLRLKVVVPTEDQEQIKLATWLSKNNILYYHVPNGGSRNMIEAVKLKRMGVMSGVPDICIPVSRSCYHGLYIELKRKEGGVVSENQEYWLAALRREGYQAVVCKGAEIAMEVITRYLDEVEVKDE